MVKIGIIGSGFGLYGLLPAFNSTKNCEVICICGSRTKRLINYCKSIGLEKIYTNWQEMLQKEKLDAIALAVPPNEQYKIAKVAIDKNLHIFAEKPLAINFTQAKELLNLAKKRKIVNAVDFLFPEIKQWQEAKQLIDEKKYGKLKQINLNWDFLSYDIKNRKSSWKTDIALGGGALSFYFSHSLYYLEYFAGRILSFKGKLSYSKESIHGGEVGIDLILKFENKVTGKAHFNCNNKKLNRHQLIFICEKATIILENKRSITSNFRIKIYNVHTLQEVNDVIVNNYNNSKMKELVVSGDENLKEDVDERVIVVKKIVARFIDSIIHKKEVTPSFSEGVRVQKLIEKIRINSNV